MEGRAVPTRVGTLKGVGWGRESHRHDGELGRRLVRGRRGGQSFDPFRPLVRVSIPLFKPSEQGSKILFFGVEDRGSCKPSLLDCAPGRRRLGLRRAGRESVRMLSCPLSGSIAVSKPFDGSSNGLFFRLEDQGSCNFFGELYVPGRRSGGG